MENTCLTERNFITDKMEINFHMLDPLMLYRVGGHVHNTDIVTIDHCGSGRRVMKFTQELAQPTGLINAICHRSVFSFSA
jgi:hypothetical protein